MRVVVMIGIGGVVVGESGMLDGRWWYWEGEGSADEHGRWDEEFHFDREEF